ATESNSTVTITANNSFVAGQLVQISGVGVAGYNGTFTIASANSTSFTYTNPTTGLGNSSGGAATVLLSGALGTGTLNLTGGTIEASGSAFQAGVATATFANPLTLQNAAVAIGGISGTTLTFSGNVLVQGNTNTITVTHPGVPTPAGLITPGVVFSGVVSGAGALTLATSGGGD